MCGLTFVTHFRCPYNTICSNYPFAGRISVTDEEWNNGSAANLRTSNKMDPSYGHAVYALSSPTAINDWNRYRLARGQNQSVPGIDLMGILNQVWWLLGFLMAAPFLMAGVGNVLAGNYPIGTLFLMVGAGVLFLPEYLKWRLLGGSSPFERIRLIGTRSNQEAE